MSFFETLFSSVLTSGEIIGLTNELKMIYLYELYKKEHRNILLVTNTLYEANQYYQILNKYTKKFSLCKLIINSYPLIIYIISSNK